MANKGVEIYFHTKNDLSKAMREMSMSTQGLSKDVDMLNDDLEMMTSKKIDMIFNDKNITNEINGILRQTKRLDSDLKKDIDAINKRKIDGIINAEQATKEINEVTEASKKLEIELTDLFQEKQGKKLAFSEGISDFNMKIKETNKEINILENNVSSLDNSTASRTKGTKSSDWIKGGMGAFLGEQVTGLMNNITSNILPNSINEGLNGAISGGMTGFALGGPIGGAVGAVLGGAISQIGAGIQRDTEMKEQRVSFASDFMINTGSQLFNDAISGASSMEQNKIAFETMLGSKNKSDKFIGNMQDFSAKTPFEFADLITSSKSMLAQGFNEKEILPTLTSIGDAASGLGMGKDGIDTVITSLGRMKNSGKVTLEYINPLVERGIDVWKIMGKATGKTTKELNDMVSKGLLPANETVLALINGMGDAFPGMMEKQSKSYDGLMSTIKDNFNQVVLNPFGTGFIEGIKPALTGFADFFGVGTDGFKNLSEDIEEFGKDIGELLGLGIDKLHLGFIELFEDSEFEKANLPDKVMMIFDKVKEKADGWFNTGGKELMDNTKTFFSDLLINIAADEGFLKAAQDLWLSISPDQETLKKMLHKSIFGASPEEREMNIDKANKEIRITHPGVGGNIGDVWNTIYNNLNPQTSEPSKKAFGQSRVPYDNYPALLHEGERVLTKQEVLQSENNSGSVTIEKLADSIIIREEKDIDKIVEKLYNKFLIAKQNYGGAY